MRVAELARVQPLELPSSVLASRTRFSSAWSSGTSSQSQTFANGSGRVRQVRGSFVSDGSGPAFHFRALRSLIPAAAAAVANKLFSMILRLSNLTCASVSIAASLARTPRDPRARRSSRTRRQDGADRQF